MFQYHFHYLHKTTPFQTTILILDCNKFISEWKLLFYKLKYRGNGPLKPIPNELIKRVEQLGREDNQSFFLFTGKHGEDYVDDPNYHDMIKIQMPIYVMGLHSKLNLRDVQECLLPQVLTQIHLLILVLKTTKTLNQLKWYLRLRITPRSCHQASQCPMYHFLILDYIILDFFVAYYM